MEKSHSKISIRIFILLSVTIFISSMAQLAAIGYLHIRGITIVSPISWYVWPMLIVSSVFILYFGVIYFEPDRRMKISLTLLGICVVMILSNMWLLLTSTVLWTFSIFTILILQTMAYYLFRQTKFAQ